MKPFSEPELEIADRLIQVIKDALRSPDEFSETSFYAQIYDFVIERWSKRIHSRILEYAPKSLALRMNESLEPVLEFPVPLSYLSNKLYGLDVKDHRAPYICNLLHHYACPCLIAPMEKENLLMAGLSDSMPSVWDKLDRYTRFSSVNISMGESGVYNQTQMKGILAHPHQPYYVYRLWAPTNKVFYIGKGDKFRALAHEKEIYSKSFKVHTNWKKLNKIAQIIHSGSGIGYEIESWHREEYQALLREEELISLAQRDNAQIICNSNGRRWAGKPNAHLLALRKSVGL